MSEQVPTDLTRDDDPTLKRLRQLLSELLSPASRAALVTTLVDEGPRPPAGLDQEALAVWFLVGLSLFSTDALPTMQTVKLEAQRALLMVSLEREDGNITRVAKALGSSRRAIRENMKKAGLV